MDPLIVFFGFGVGVMVGMTGMGGAAIMTPLLILFFGIPPITAIGTDIAYQGVTKSVGTVQHLRLKTVNVRLALWLAIGSVPTAVAGVFFIRWLADIYGDKINQVILFPLAGALLLVGGGLLIRTLFNQRAADRERHDIELDRRHKVMAVVTGAVTGIVVGVTSAGSGFMVAVVLILAYRLIPRRVVGTDITHAAILMLAAGAAHVLAGNVDFLLMGTLLVGSIPGIWLGSHLSVKLPTGALRTALSILVVSSGVALINKAGIAIPAPVLLTVPVFLAVVAGGLYIVRSKKLSLAQLRSNDLSQLQADS